MQRVARLIGLKPECVAEYKRWHASIWPELAAHIKSCNISNYTIFLREPENLLFLYFEYGGDDLEADMRRLAGAEVQQRWQAVMRPMQQPLATRAAGEWMVTLEEVFRLD
jgi:L-rhamnose mutarotase